MAKNYQRHSKGGRFRRTDIGDAGIRSYRQQQQTIIDSIKLRQAQDKDISRDQIAGLEGVAAKQADNQRILDNLETKIFNNKLGNVQKRQKSEVDRLEDQAKEYQKQSDFWKDFSTTYSKEYGKLAFEANDFRDRLWVNKNLDMFLDNFDEVINFKADYLREGAHKTLEESLVKAAREKGRDPDEVKTIIRLMTRSNKRFDIIKVKEITDNITAIEENLKRTVIESPDLKWGGTYKGKSVVLGHYQQAAKNLIVKAGIRPNSAEARQLYAVFTRKGTAAARKADLNEEFITDGLTEDTLLKAVPAETAEKRPQAAKELYEHVRTKVTKNKDGTFTQGIANPKEAYFATGQLLALRYKDKEQFIEVMKNIPTDWNGKEVTWTERFKEQEFDEEIRLREVWDKAHKDRLGRDSKQAKLEDAAALAQVKTFLKENDITTKAGADKLESLANEHAGKTETFKLIKTAQAFDFEGKDKFYLSNQIVKSWKDGVPSEFRELYYYSSDSFKEKFKPLLEDIDALENASGYVDGRGIGKYAETYIMKNVLKREDWNDPQAHLVKHVITAYENEFYKKFYELRDVENPDQRWRQAQEYTDNLVDKSLGAFRRKEETGGVKWLAWETEEEKSYTSDSIKDKLDINKAAINPTIKGIVLAHQQGKKSIVSQDTVDELIIDISKGRSVDIPEEIETLFNNQVGTNKPYETIEDLVKEIFKKDKDINIKGAFDYQKYVKKTSTLTVPDEVSTTKNERSFLTALMWLIDPEKTVWPKRLAMSDAIERATLEGREVDISDLDDPIRIYNYYG